MNLLNQDDAERVPNAYGDWYERLRDLEQVWDPDNPFRTNQNIKPAE